MFKILIYSRHQILNRQPYERKIAYTMYEFADRSGPASKARTVFARPNPEIVGSNRTRGIDVCVCSVCVYSVCTPCGGG
jgi:hypothetical protein